jgi:hypothetical protein
MTDRSTLAMRANGTAFAILYEPRAIPDTATPPKKTGPKPKVNPDQSYKAKVLRDLDNSAPNFNVQIASKADSLRTQAIKGRL